MSELVARKEDFCTETNLANRTFAQRIPQWQAAGYQVVLYYLWLPDPAFAVARVAQRVSKGGHDVPTATIYRRYYLGLRHFFDVYMPIVDRWRLYDSSRPEGPILIERGVRQIQARETWLDIRRVAYSKEADDAIK